MIDDHKVGTAEEMTRREFKRARALRAEKGDTQIAKSLTYIVMKQKIEAIKIAFESHRDNLLELSGNLNQIAHEPELPEEYHYALEKIATNMISYGELRKILEAEG